MAIAPDTIEQVAAANDIVEVIGAYFPLKRAGASFKALCPFHQEKSPSFNVSPQRQSFHCCGCGAGGSVFRFVMDYEHLDFPAAVKKLATRVGIAIVEDRTFKVSDDRQHEARQTLLKLHAEVAEWFHHNLTKKPIAAAAREYLKNRGIDSRIAQAWQLGFAPDSWDAFTDWATGQGYRRVQLVQSGLVKLRDESRVDGEIYDRFRERIIFPIRNDVGEVIAFSGRALSSEATAAKYINSPETPLFRKGSVLFGLDKTKRALIDANRAIVCEGQLDLISLFECGVTNVVAPQGTAFTEAQARVLKRYVEEVILCFDADVAGEKAAERSLEALLQNDLSVRVAVMPAGDDPDSLVRREGRAAFEQRIADARDFFDYRVERGVALTDPNSVGARVQLARDLAASVSHLRDPLMRGQVASKVSARIGIPVAEFERLLSAPNSARTRSSPSGDTSVRKIQTPTHESAMLCLLVLRDSEAREFLRAEDWKAVLDQVAGSELLQKILEADLDNAEPASMTAFMATLAPNEEAAVASWLMQRVPDNALHVTKGWWNGVRRAALARELRSAEARIRAPQITTGETVALQKQILDLQAQLHELPTLSPARALDS